MDDLEEQVEDKREGHFGDEHSLVVVESGDGAVE